MSRAARLRSGSRDERIAAIGEIAAGAAADDVDLDALVACLGDGRKAVQRPAAEVLASLAVRHVAVRERLLKALAETCAALRWGAAYALAQLHPTPREILPVLLETLGSDDGDLRWAAARLLPRAADRDTVVDLLRDLAASGNAPQRKMALYVLRDLDARTPGVESEVTRRLDDPDRDVRLAAIAALARLTADATAAARRLVAVLMRDDPPVRRAAAAALGVVGDASPEVVSALRTAAAGDDAALARAAERALAALRSVSR